MTNRLPILFSILILSTVAARADGPERDRKTNRYTGGPKLVFNLTQEQKEFLELDHASFEAALLTLTIEQQESIFKAWGIRPTKVDVWETRNGVWDCACHAANSAFRFDADSIEIGKEFVTTDAYAEKVWRAEATLHKAEHDEAPKP